MASVRTTTAVKAGVLSRPRITYRSSFMRPPSSFGDIYPANDSHLRYYPNCCFVLLSASFHKYGDVFLDCRRESKALRPRLVFVTRVIRPGHPAKRDKELRRAMQSRCARCPGLMTRATISLRLRQFVTVFTEWCTKERCRRRFCTSEPRHRTPRPPRESK